MHQASCRDRAVGRVRRGRVWLEGRARGSAPGGWSPVRVGRPAAAPTWIARVLTRLPVAEARRGDTSAMSQAADYEQELRRRRTAGGENRIPPAIAVIVAGVVYALLPGDLLVGPRLIIPGVELALLIALVITNPRRIVRQTRWSRTVSIALAGVMIAANLVALALLITTLNKSNTPGTSLLVGGMQVWLTNVIGFGLLYWELDRGGPVARHALRRDRMQPADWRFSQDENSDAVVEVAASSSEKSGWIPTLIDYLYLSLTNSSALARPTPCRSPAAPRR